MTVPEGPVVLDTNVVLHLARGNEFGRRLDAAYRLQARPFRPILSIVSVGELLAFAKRRAWGADRSDRLNQIIKQLVVFDINRAIAERYAAIHTFLIGSGRAVGENDVWIAATAAATSALLVTTDKDFEALAGTFLQVSVFALHPGNP
ncbi:type II toxin-antitoxin system VapC family toxin [Sorangium sp. So ce1153]|uniref:type II toxin-antitoxin system VapC family toxin n=1 Tax=Sorangium sp. So ce1153 TaxID=3133333 RepID=UPI003F5DBBE2